MFVARLGAEGYRVQRILDFTTREIESFECLYSCRVYVMLLSKLIEYLLLSSAFMKSLAVINLTGPIETDASSAYK